MMPDILKQVGPQQYQFLKTQLGNLGADGKAADDDDDDVPQLVGNFEDAAKKWESSLIRPGWVNIESIESLTESIELGIRIQEGCNAPSIFLFPQSDCLHTYG